MGEAKRRKAAGADRRANTFPPVTIADTPGDHAHVPGTITVHVLHGNGSSLSSSIPLGDVAEAIDIGNRIHKKLGGSVENCRKQARSWIAGQLNCDNDHMKQPIATNIAISALWLACTAPDGQGEIIRAKIKEDAAVALLITEHEVYGRRAINGRTVAASPDTTLAEIVEMLGVGPGKGFMTHKLAPH